jgi:hypothetical protein
MVVYEDLQVSFAVCKTYQYNLETKRKVSSNTVLKYAYRCKQPRLHNRFELHLKCNPSSGITICRKMDQVNAVTNP